MKTILSTIERKNGKAVVRFNPQQAMAAAVAATGDNVRYMAVKGDDGKQHYYQEIVPTEEILNVMRMNGDIFDVRQYHRFVTAHFLDMLVRRRKYDTIPQGEGVTANYLQENIKRLGLNYQWVETRDRLRAISKAVSNGDNKNAIQDSHFYNFGLVLDMFDELIIELEDAFAAMHKYHCRDREYYKYKSFGRLLNKNTKRGVFVEDVREAIDEIRHYKRRIASVMNSSYDEAIKIFEEFVTVMPDFDKINKCRFDKPFKMKQCYSWQNAYKGFGAYFTMKNLIMGEYKLKLKIRGYVYSGAEAKDALRAEIVGIMGYELVGMCKDFLNYNHFNILEAKTKWFNDRMANRK